MRGGSIGKLDKTTDVSRVIQYEHSEIHNGDHYTLADFATVTPASTVDFVVTTPDTTKWGHLLFDVSALTGPAQFDLYEGSSSNADGTLITPINNNRNSANLSGLVIRLNPTGISVGSRLTGASVGSAGGVLGIGLQGGAVGRDAEFVLRQNEVYLLRFTNTHTANQILNYQANWYEHTNYLGLGAID